jgi:hypothetical protein
MARSFEKLEDKHVHFQIQARSGVVQAGYFNLRRAKVVVSGENKAQAKVKLVRVKELTPKSMSFKESIFDLFSFNE